MVYSRSRDSGNDAIGCEVVPDIGSSAIGSLGFLGVEWILSPLENWNDQLVMGVRTAQLLVTKC